MVAPTPSPGPVEPAGAESEARIARATGLGDLPGTGGSGLAGLAALAAISVASLAVTLVRRRNARSRMVARIATRLASFVAPEAAPLGPSVGRDIGPGPDIDSSVHGPRSTGRA
jgi:LPXTG-motif cell wall-anchored protein